MDRNPTGIDQASSAILWEGLRDVEMGEFCTRVREDGVRGLLFSTRSGMWVIDRRPGVIVVFSNHFYENFPKRQGEEDPRPDLPGP
jgi:hypothetical protein